MSEDIFNDQPIVESAAADQVSKNEAVVAAPEKATKGTAKKKSKKSAVVRQVTTGRTYVKATYNNTIVTFTDQNGNVLSWCSAGQCGFKGPKKATPYASTLIVKNAAEKVKKYGLKEVSVFVKGIGGGREAAVRALNANGFTVTSIKDITPIPHNGCRAPRPRRV
ncbi:MAG: 30S ribosomal protein S11 [Candidatus Buchananbacteria bacterium]|jgi:small subunit ribosomal protein S11